MTDRALITGASSGLGREYARELARQRHDVVLVARDLHKLNELASELSTMHGIRADVVSADLSTLEGLQRTVDVLADTADPVDVLVNNAGASLAGWFGTTDINDEDHQLDLLVRAPMYLMDAAIKTMVGRGHGAVINVSSVAAYTPRGVYSAHKMWLLNLTEWAHHHYADSGVKILAVCPGFVRTEFHQRGQMDISAVPGWMWLSAPRVVRDSLRDLSNGRAVSVPSRRYRFLAALARHLPRRLVQRVAKTGR